jgi:ATP/maltotriose-dependent transcriptional regulator MalT
MITDIYFSLEQSAPPAPFPQVEWDEAAHLIEECAENLLLTNDLTTLANWLEVLPVELVLAQPRLGLYRTLLLLISGRLEEVEPTLVTLEKTLDSYYLRFPETPVAERRKLAGEIAAVRSTQAILEHNLARTLHLSDKTRVELSSTGLSWWLTSIDLYLAASYRWNKNTVAVALSLSGTLATTIASKSLSCTLKILRFMAEFYYSQQDLRLAAVTCQHLLQLAGDKEGPYEVYRGYTVILLGKIAFNWNKLSEAGQLFQQGLELGVRLNHLDLVYKGYAHLSRLKKAQGDLEKSREFMDKVEQLEKDLTYRLRYLSRSYWAGLLAALHSGSGPVAEPAGYYPKETAPRLLNRQEIEIIHLLENDFSNREIASKMIVTENTVKYHLKRIFQKLQVNDRTQAVKRSRELRLI